jgi:hypothetical protein
MINGKQARAFMFICSQGKISGFNGKYFMIQDGK